MNYRLSDLVTKFGGQLIGDDVVVTNIKPLNTATAGSISFLKSAKYKKDLVNTAASALICAKQFADLSSLPKIICDNPSLYYCYVSQLFNSQVQLPRVIKSTAVIANSTKLGRDIAICDNVVIGDNCIIGDNCQIYPNVVIGDNVVLGKNIIIYPNVTIYSNVQIGDDSIIHAGVVIGSDGFGYAKDNNLHYHKIPQVGGVRIGNKVEIGANSTIDSGALSPTIIGDGVIIDNLVQIAHNVTIGDHTAIAACVGIGGSCNIGKYCTLAGGAGIGDHVDLCDHTVIGGFSGVGKSIVKPDLYMSSYPARPYKEYAKIAIHLKDIADMVHRLKNLEKQFIEIRGEINGNC